MRWSFGVKWIVAGFGLSVLLLVAASFNSFQNATRLAESTYQVKETHEVLEALVDIVANLNEAESRRRGYIFFGDAVELERYKLVVQEFAPKLDAIKPLVADNPNQQKRLMILKRLLKQKLILFDRSISLYEQGIASPISQAPLTELSDRKRAAIQRLITEMQQEEEKELVQWVRQSQLNIQHRMFLEFFGTIMSFAFLAGMYASLFFLTLKRQQAETSKRTLLQEKELSELKLNFFSMVSHEFRTPLSIIIGSTQLLVESLQKRIEREELKDLLRIQASAQLMTKLLTDILTLSRAEAGKLECNPEWVEMQSFCLNLLEDIQLADDFQHPVKFTQQGHFTHAMVDERLLYSILSNLLSNAMKYSSKGSVVYFNLTYELNTVTFQIKDDGIGIPPESWVNLYQPFHRGSNVRGRVGTGLGLAVVKKCLDRLGGHITLHSEVEVGTTFTVRIPHKSYVDSCKERL